MKNLTFNKIYRLFYPAESPEEIRAKYNISEKLNIHVELVKDGKITLFESANAINESIPEEASGMVSCAETAAIFVTLYTLEQEKKYKNYEIKSDF